MCSQLLKYRRQLQMLMSRRSRSSLEWTRLHQLVKLRETSSKATKQTLFVDTEIGKGSSISELRNGKLIILMSGQKKLWFECNGQHTFKYHAKPPSSFQYSCGDWTDENGLQNGSYPWITRYLPSNSSTRGKNTFSTFPYL